MLSSPIDDANKTLLKDAFKEIEKYSDSDVLVYSGSFTYSIDSKFKELIENIQNKKNNLVFILTTTGGSLIPVIRIVDTLRHFYNSIDFYVPDYAYSAGTIMCCSGDRIFMDYNSALGPIDPQVQTKDGSHFVSALGYLDKLDELLQKAKDNTITKPEFMILKDFDLGEWKSYEQARDLAIDLLKKWLPKYKFKNWKTHSSTNQSVTEEEKQSRAEEIAKNLSDNNKWKSHGRPINRDELSDLKLKIDKMENNGNLYTTILKYNAIMDDFMQKYGYKTFIQTKEDCLYG